MKFNYDPETDALYVHIGEGYGVETREVLSGFNIDLDASGAVIGFEFDHLSQLASYLGALDVQALPLQPIAAGKQFTDAA